MSRAHAIDAVSLWWRNSPVDFHAALDHVPVPKFCEHLLVFQRLGSCSTARRPSPPGSTPAVRCRAVHEFGSTITSNCFRRITGIPAARRTSPAHNRLAPFVAPASHPPPVPAISGESQMSAASLHWASACFYHIPRQKIYLDAFRIEARHSSVDAVLNLNPIVGCLW